MMMMIFTMTMTIMIMIMMIIYYSPIAQLSIQNFRPSFSRGNAPEISSSASKVRKAHYVTQVASGMHPRTSVSYNGRGRTTLQEPATAHASSSAPDVLTPVEVAPSFKASKKASENGETLKVVMTYPSLYQIPMV